ncbi:hypothetical protein ACIBO2_10525 [Nonomuraea sp. NPDC050022]
MPSMPDRRMTPARTLIFAIAAGLAVGNRSSPYADKPNASL